MLLAQCQVVKILEATTGYKLSDKDNTRPLLYSHNTGDIFYKATLRRAFGINDEIDFTKNINIDPASGDVIFRKGTILATAPGNKAKCKEDLLTALQIMETIPELPEVVLTYNKLKEVTKATKEKLESIWLVGFVPGKCSVCEQLGI